MVTGSHCNRLVCWLVGKITFDPPDDPQGLKPRSSCEVNVRLKPVPFKAGSSFEFFRESVKRRPFKTYLCNQFYTLRKIFFLYRIQTGMKQKAVKETE